MILLQLPAYKSIARYATGPVPALLLRDGKAGSKVIVRQRCLANLDFLP